MNKISIYRTWDSVFAYRLDMTIWIILVNETLWEATARAKFDIWAATWDFQQCGMCDQQSLISACAYAQSGQSLSWSRAYSTSWTSLGITRLKRRLHLLVWVYSCQNATLLGIACQALLCCCCCCCLGFLGFFPASLTTKSLIVDRLLFVFMVSPTWKLEYA